MPFHPAGLPHETLMVSGVVYLKAVEFFGTLLE
jgi:hypothetical protein